MYANYTLKDNTKLGIYIWSDFIENKTWREFAEVDVLDDNYLRTTNKHLDLPLHKDGNGIYVVYNGENVYLNDFDYMPYDELMRKIKECIEKKDKWIVFDDQILATFLREFEKVGIVGDMPVFDVIIPSMGIGMISDNEIEILTVLSEKRYKKLDWHYKITLVAEDESLRGIVASRDIYFGDFCDLLKSGIYRLVNKDEYKNNHRIDKTISH